METVNTLHVVYGLGGTCAALLFAYLVYALVRAEEF
jgi:K+-transporting ATPase KdpF subunit